MKPYLINLSLICLFFLPLNAQEYAPIEDPQLIKKFDQVLINTYPHLAQKVAINKAYKINEKHSLIEYSDGSSKYQTVVNSSRNEMFVVVQFKEIPKNKVPQIVIDQLNEDSYSNWKFVKGFEAQKPSSDIFYALEIKKNDEVKKVYFDSNGGFYKRPF